MLKELDILAPGFEWTVGLTVQYMTKRGNILTGTVNGWSKYTLNIKPNFSSVKAVPVSIVRVDNSTRWLLKVFAD